MKDNIVIYGQSKHLNPAQGLSADRRILVEQANRLLKQHKLSNKLAKKRKRVSS